MSLKINSISSAKDDFVSVKEVIKFEPTKNKTNDVFLNACWNGELKVVKKWIKDCKTLEITDKQGRTPLMLASACNNELVFNLVFKHTEARILHAIDELRQNALHYACYSDRLGRVQLLLEKKVKVICSVYESVPALFANNPEIKALIHEDCQNVLDQQAAIMEDIQQKYPNDLDKQIEEMFQRTGRRMKLFHIDDHLSIEIGENYKEKFLENPKTKEEIKEIFKNEIPKNINDAANKLEENFGFEFTRDVAKDLLKETKISTRADVLNDRKVKLAIANHFKQNPPKSLKEASQYIVINYKCHCKDEILTKFLAWCGIRFDSNELDSID